ncbi:CGNR zinc finger domain-containing protein [Clavibacter michiganensis]|uniref:CGNR zinc finger domain-containing protein n=1 Tax=Clavibacter michiganensis TaxID=28447 RepID=UPI00292D401E|nr:CGNR zinc finger domain-containing protein [Clavibacter michiganensis]
MADQREFRIDGGATWLNLLATRGRSFGARPVERLADPEAAHRWLALMGWAPTAAVTETQRERLVALREALRDLAMAAVSRAEPPPTAADLVHRAAAGHPHPLDSPAAPVEEAIRAIATQALVTLRGPDRLLLAECAESDCRWVFLDTSGRRHWCPAPECASRGRVRAHRARQAASSA